MNKLIHYVLVLLLLLLNACAQHKPKTSEPVKVLTQISSNKDNKPEQKEQEVEVIEVTEELQTNKEKAVDDDALQKTVKAKPEQIPAKQESKPDIVAKKTTSKAIKTHTISGKIVLNTDAVKDKEVNLSSAVVYFQPDGFTSTNIKKTNHTIASQNKRFVPNVLAIQKGSTVTFPNMDRILHNVFSVSNIQKFDLGLYSSGKEKTVTFENSGIIYVHCNVHHSMQADILVLDTPFYTYVDENGDFTLNNIPNTSGDLFVWHPRAKLQKISSENVKELSHINQTLNIVRKKIPKHTNKFGAPYRPKRKS